MKRLAIPLLVILLIMTGTSVASAAYPNPGTGKSVIYLQNTGASDASVSLQFTTGETGGAAGSYAIAQPIPVKSMKIVPYTVFPPSSPWAGAVEVQSTEPLAAVVALLWDNATAGSHAAGFYKGTDAPSNESYLSTLRYKDGRQTSKIVIQNTEDVTAAVKIHWYDRNGSENVSKLSSLTIPPKSEKTVDLAPIDPFVATFNTGSAYITSTTKIATLATLHFSPYDYNASDVYSGVSQGETTLWVPSVFRKLNTSCGDPNSTPCYYNYNVTVVQNLGTETANVVAQFYRWDGQLSTTLTGTIPAKSSLPYNTAIQAGMTITDFTQLKTALTNNWRGTMKITCTNGQPLAGVTTFWAPFAGTPDAMFYSAIGDGEATSTGLAFPAVFRKRNAGADSVVSATIIQNVSGTDGRLQVEFWNGATQQKVPGSWTVNIKANGTAALNLSTPIGLPQSALDTLGTNFTGSMYVTPLDGISIIGVNDVYWDYPGIGRAGAYTGFPQY